MEDPRSDAELLRELRDGDHDAYVVLWERHIGAALRHARRLMPSRAEGLASESFLAIYQQVTTTGTGPDFAFRSYLKAVIRNTAIRWRKDANRFDDTVEADAVDFRDALSLVERESNANELLGAFQELPERWQKVLWLSEVAEVARPEIARELGIKPNAVSALHRRARSGLKVQWLTRQIPLVLRDDETHAARLLPRHLSEPDDQVLELQVTTHLTTCEMCSDLLVSLRTHARRLQGVTLSAVGFGAGTDPDAPLTPGVSNPSSSTGYLAPTIAGTTEPGSTVIVEMQDERYTPDVADDGSWSFDPRGIVTSAGTYEYSVWADDGTTQSVPTVGTFTIEPIIVEGFENITGFWDMQVPEASTTGVVVAFTGAPNGAVFVGAGGRTVVIPLDETGHAVKRLRMYTATFYWFEFRAMDGVYMGPVVERPLDVYDPDVIIAPYDPGDQFEFVDP